MPSKIILYDSLGNPVELDGDALKGGLATAWAVTSAEDTISHSYNIASITFIVNGVYDIVFATPMDNIGYAVAGTLVDEGGGAGFPMHVDNDVPKTVSGFRLVIIAVAPTFVVGAGAAFGFSFTVHGGKT